MKVLLLSKYDNLGPSSRVRSYQYIPYLKQKGINVAVAPLFSNNYVKNLYGKKNLLPQLITAYLKRIKYLLTCNKYDLIWLEKELFPWIPYLDEFILSRVKIPYIVDYDDAIFHRYDQHGNLLIRSMLGNKIPSIMKKAQAVIVGNEYLYKIACVSGAKKIVLLPTVIDLKRYEMQKKITSDYFTIGWIGSPITLKYLQDIHEVFRQFKYNDESKLLLIGAMDNAVEDIDVVCHEWESKTEAKLLQNCDVGIMPLTDSPWEQGKCGYKLIQYMACELPVIASPVGANLEIVDNGVNGFLAASTDDWVDRLEFLYENHNIATRLGQAGRKKVEQQYSLQVTAPKLAEVMKGL